MTPAQEALATQLSEMAGKAGARTVFADKADPVTISITETELAEMLAAACFASWGAACGAFEGALSRRIEGPEGHVGWLIKQLMILQAQHGDLPVSCGQDGEAWDSAQVVKIVYLYPNAHGCPRIAVMS